MSNVMTCFGALVVMWCQQPDPPPPPPPVVVCLQSQEWSRDYQNRLAEQLAGIPDGTPLMNAMNELISLRDQNKTCKKLKKSIK